MKTNVLEPPAPRRAPSRAPVAGRARCALGAAGGRLSAPSLRLTSATGLGRRLYDPDVPKPVDLRLRVHRRDFIQQSLALRKVISRIGDERLTPTKRDPESP